MMITAMIKEPSPLFMHNFFLKILKTSKCMNYA